MAQAETDAEDWTKWQAVMKLYHKNPRQITEKQFTDLGSSLSRLGDLGGIVHDLNSDEIIGGNQRSRVFDVNKCEIELVEQYAEPDEQGTVGVGFVLWKGKRYAYRQVRWTPKQCEEANIRANKNGGSFDFDTLANEFELDDLLEWGFKGYELGQPGAIDDPNAEWKGMPEFEMKDNKFRSLIVHFENFIDLIDQNITDKTKFIWFPEREKEIIGDKEFVNES